MMLYSPLKCLCGVPSLFALPGVVILVVGNGLFMAISDQISRAYLRQVILMAVQDHTVRIQSISELRSKQGFLASISLGVSPGLITAVPSVHLRWRHAMSHVPKLRSWKPKGRM